MHHEIRYYKDLEHNYLVIKGMADREKETYHNKMITGNYMKNMLPCSIRMMNGEPYFYYEISSRQNIRQFYGNRSIGLSGLHHLFEAIDAASKEAKEYLLDDAHIILEPEYLFINPGTKEYFFLYFPQENNCDSAMTAFAEFLVDKVDHEEDKAVEIVYYIYEHIVNHTFILSEILELLSSAKEIPVEKEDICQTETDNEIQETGSVRGRQEYRNEFEAGYGTEKEPEYEIENESSSFNGQSGGRMASAVLLLVSIVTVAVIFGIRYFFVLTPEESVLTIAGMVVLAVISALLLLHLLVSFTGNRSGGFIKQENIMGSAQEERDYGDGRNITHDLWMDARIHKTMAAVPAEKRNDKSDSFCENTVFIEETFSNLENKLYGINKGNRYHIDLSVLPCTIGKMAGGVDIVIRDETVSRIHARFTREGKTVFVTDLNSTNGTFKNGLRLEPNETVCIEPGDEIRFGRMAFSYR